MADISQAVLITGCSSGIGRATAEQLARQGHTLYHATKHAVEAISDALRFEVKGFGVDVSIIEPGLLKTNFAETSVGSVSHADRP